MTEEGGKGERGKGARLKSGSSQVPYENTVTDLYVRRSVDAHQRKSLIHEIRYRLVLRCCARGAPAPFSASRHSKQNATGAFFFLFGSWAMAYCVTTVDSVLVTALEHRNNEKKC